MPSKSKQQQKFMGMVHALKKGDIEPSSVSKSVKDVAKSMSKKDAKDFASTKHKNLPRKVKQEILNKLKEYSNKMGRDNLGGDDYTSKRKGGLRDFDGYDNVDYNKDIPMDEARRSVVHKAVKKGSFPVTLVVVKNGKVIDQELVKTPEAVPASFNVIQSKHKGAKIHIEDKTGKRLFTEDSPASSHPLGKKEVTQGVKVIEMLDVIAHWMFGPDYHKLTTQQKKEVHKEAIRGKIIKKTPFKESVSPQVLQKLNLGLKKINRKFKGASLDGKTIDIELHPGHDRDSEIYKIYDLLKKLKLNKHKTSIFNESVNEGPIDRIIGGRPYKYVGDGRKGKAIVSGPLKDRERKDILKRAKKAGYSASPGIKGGVVIQVESIYEGMFSTIDQIRQDSKDVRDFVKNVFADRDFRKLKNDKEFLKYLKSIYEGIDESKGVPQNYMSGRTSDYHTALRGKNRDYSGGTNFKKKDHGQPDVENEDDDQETNQLSNKQTHIKSDKLKVSEEMGNLSSSERIELYKLYSKAMKAMPGSPNQKKIKVLINKLRKKANLKPLPEYGQRLDLSFIEDEEAKLKGTPKPKDSIDRNIDESTINELGVFPVQNYVQGIIPSSFIDTTTRDKKERLKSTLRDLKSTLNHFWKSHKIPYRIR